MPCGQQIHDGHGHRIETAKYSHHTTYNTVYYISKVYRLIIPYLKALVALTSPMVYMSIRCCIRGLVMIYVYIAIVSM